MAGGKTAYLSQAMLDHVLGGATFTQPATVYIALSAAAYDPNATGTAMSELDDTVGAYARLAVTNDSSSWAAASAAAPSVKSNVNDLAFAAATADWAEPLSAYICDAATGGNTLYGADFTTPTPTSSGDTFKILAGTFIISED
jgi:hypothetical protein